MADYMSILQQSIDGLPENTPTARLALYRRARETVEKQLRSMPDLSEDAIRSQLTVLGQAMTRIERGFSGNRPSLSRPRPVPSSAGPRPVQPSAASSPRQTPSSGDRPRPQSAASASSDAAPRRPAPPSLVRPAPPEAGPSAKPPLARKATPPEASPSETSAPDAVVQPTATQPTVENQEAARPDAAPSRPPRPKISPETAARLAEVKSSRMPRIAFIAMLCLVVIGSGALAYHYWQRQPVRIAGTQPAAPIGIGKDEKGQPRRILARQPDGPSSDDPTTSTYDGRDAKIEVIPVKPVRNRSSTRTASIGAAGLPDAPARQRAILYEQTSQEEGDASISGTVSWQPQRDGEAAHAVIELPDRDAQISMLIRINSDPDLPASHLIELRFNDPRALGGTVRAIPTIVAKPTEQARGEPLVGVDVPVTDRVHWIALSADEEQRDRNVNLLREGKWFDIPILFHDGKRALLTIEKGGPDAMRLDPVLSKKS